MTTSSNNETIANTTVMLDQLLAGYQGIFEQAQAQLEQVEFTDAHIDRVADKINGNTKLQKLIENNVLLQLSHQLSKSNLDEMPDHVEKFIEAVTMKVFFTFEKQFEAHMKKACDEFFNSDYIEKRVNEKLNANSEISTAMKTKATLREAFALAFDLDKEEPDSNE